MRLIDMGIEPYLVFSTLIGSMAQRLVRKICSKCKKPWTPDLAKLPKDLRLEPGDVLYQGEGCDHCRQTGFRGRCGIYELMLSTDEVVNLIMRRAPTYEVVESARKAGLRLLREDGWLKVKRGVTVVDEVVSNSAI
jgi:type II secretory ATPase GspE/PulE/Tfp pilus assembly ATPase PilB-like protein